MKQRFLLLLFFFVFGEMSAQVRRNAPLLSFSSVPIWVLEEGVTGWVRTTNGQWISEEGVIPKRFSSFLSFRSQIQRGPQAQFEQSSPGRSGNSGGRGNCSKL